MVVTSSRAAAIRYKKAFDRYVAQHAEYGHIHSLIAFSGKVTGKQVMQGTTSNSRMMFIVDEKRGIHRGKHEPGGKGRICVWPLIARSIASCWVATSSDRLRPAVNWWPIMSTKKIANDVEIVQTFSRLFRMAPGRMKSSSSTSWNDPENVRRAFAMYDDGAQIEDATRPQRGLRNQRNN